MAFLAFYDIDFTYRIACLSIWLDVPSQTEHYLCNLFKVPIYQDKIPSRGEAPPVGTGSDSVLDSPGLPRSSHCAGESVLFLLSFPPALPPVHLVVLHDLSGLPGADVPEVWYPNSGWMNRRMGGQGWGPQGLYFSFTWRCRGLSSWGSHTRVFSRSGSIHCPLPCRELPESTMRPEPTNINSHITAFNQAPAASPIICIRLAHHLEI